MNFNFLGKITALVNQRMQRLRPVLAKVWTAWCPDCGQPTVLLESRHAGRAHGPEDDQPRCAFCTTRWDSRRTYVGDFTSMRLGLSYHYAAHNGDSPNEHCPECGEEMLVWYDPDTGERGPKPHGRCFFCECEFNDRCPRCDAPVNNPSEDESMICYDCIENIRHED